MPETNTERTDTAASRSSEPSPVVGRSDAGQFVKVTYLRPEFEGVGAAQPGAIGGQPKGSRPSAPSQPSRTGYRLVTLVRDKAATTTGAGMGMLGLLALRSWRR
jgi:hypothetical protein